ncbi:MAG: NADH-quinone oxidoreductase subunit J [Chloroflexaceae bacterium]|jgi:NADH-quinone oxidoreductase subunit J|nr:NADH-quinone oxidoreductase subunit J [Chloroflexaceae bacterium]
MTIVIQIIFALIAMLILGSALMMVLAKNVIHSALWLIASFFGVGALYLLLQAEFLAVVQVLVYVGAISILILFAIMLTRAADLAGETGRQWNNRWWLSLAVAGLLFGALIVPTVIGETWNVAPTEVAGAAAGQATGIAGAAELGRGFVYEYLLQFQVIGVLLLVALIGAIVIAYDETARRRRVLTLAEELELKKRQEAREAKEAKQSRKGKGEKPLPAPVPTDTLSKGNEGNEGNEGLVVR